MQRPIIKGFRLSPQQIRLWLLQLGNETLDYYSTCRLLIEGNLRLATLEEALKEVISRHEILRTTFQRVPGMKIPVQVLSDGNPLVWKTFDCAGSNDGEIEPLVEKLLKTEERSTDDFTSPRLRCSLYRLSAQKHILVISLPSLCADHRGMINLIRAISRYYSAKSRGEELSDSPIQYKLAAEWLNGLLESDIGEAGREYWKKQIIGQPNRRLHSQYHLPYKALLDASFCEIAFAADLLTQLKDSSVNNNVSLSVLLLACWNIILTRITGEPDIVVGAAYDGRSDEELEGAIGPYARYLPIRFCSDATLTFNKALSQINESVANAYAWQECFSWDLIPSPAASTLPSYFPFCFDFQSLPPGFIAGDLKFTILRQQSCIDRFNLKLSCVEREDSLAFEFHYDANLFDASYINCLADQYLTLVRSVLEAPETPVGRLNLLSPSQRQWLVDELNLTASPLPATLTTARLFESQVEAFPDRIAAVCEQSYVSYEGLNEAANRLADYVLEEGAGAELPVAICLHRSLEILISVLACLKAGAPFLPLDPDHPAERIAYMLEDARAVLLLSDQELVDRLRPGTMRVICPDSALRRLAERSEGNLGGALERSQAAYLMYTSGSTGLPKAVMVTQEGLANYLWWARGEYPFGEGGGAVVHTPLSFDLTITTLLGALMAGEAVRLLPEATGIETLEEALGSGESYSVVKLTPTHLKLLRQGIGESGVKASALVIGGEALMWEEIKSWQDAGSERRLINEYGPTETVVGCAWYEVGGEGRESGGVPIGRPIANTELYLLDPDGEPAPVGVEGELFIGGAGLARGYLNKPDLTAERFVPHAFSSEGGRRLYRTGDLGRYLPDGRIEYLGRADQQVKIRGFRIELGEIETWLRGHPMIKDAAVEAREEESGEKRLVAYLVENLQSGVANEELRSYLGEKLPEYMIPSAFVRLEGLPVTSNGKLDRKTLPAPDQIRPSLIQRYVAARTPLEELLAAT